MRIYIILHKSIYSARSLNTGTMTPEEWETPRVPRRERPAMMGGYHPRQHAINEYLALEHPREHPAWILRRLPRDRSR